MARLHLCGLILAAGESSRMGRDKALLLWPQVSPHSPRSTESSLLAASIHALQSIAEHIVVVAGKNIDALAPIVTANGAVLMHNPEPDRGQFSSLQIGLRQVVELGYESVALTPVDAPPLRPSTLRLLQTAYSQARAHNLWAVTPEHNGRHGHPLFAGLPLINAFLRADIANNARSVQQAHEQFIGYSHVDDPFVGVEMNTPQEYAALAGIAGSLSC